jgi:hypothetical protein
MIKNYIKSAIAALFLSVAFSLSAQTGNISINLGGNASTNPAILDLSDATNAHLGFLMPNVSLASATDAATIPSPNVGMIVWNTNASMPFGVGFYYWSGSHWFYVINSSLAAGPTGSGTANYLVRWTGPSTLGTGVAQDNGTGVSISSSALTPVNKLDVNGNAAFGTYAGTAAPTNGMIISGHTGIGTSTPNASAALDVTSTTQGLLPPRLLGSQITSISSPATGLMVFNTTTGCVQYYNGTGWQNIECPCTGTPATPGAISGPSTFCSGSTGNVYTIAAVTGASWYAWTVPPGATITSGNGTTSITVTFGSTSGNITVTASNTCGTSLASTFAATLTAIPATPGAITGTTPICTFGQTGITYSIAAVTGATSYTWSVPAGIGTITGGQGTTSITITSAGSASTGNITVTASNICGTSAASSITVILTQTPATPGAITGTASYCNQYSGTGKTYSIAAVPNATSYTWTVPAAVGTITAGQGTTGITITLASSYGTGNITVTATNACGTSAASTLGVTVNGTPPTPGTITGSNPICTFSSAVTYTIAAVPGATSYTWTVPSSVGSSFTGQGTTSITITAASSTGTGNITVTATNSCGTSAASSLSVTVTQIPATPGAITGTTLYCSQYSLSGNTYSIAAVPNATSYTWTVPAAVGTLNTGQGTTSITMTTAASNGNGGNITVTATDACGTSAASSLAVQVTQTPATPGAITGTTSPSINSANTYTVAAVTGATSYNWSVSNTYATVTATAANSATITCASTAGTYNICVAAHNSCGNSATSCLSVTSTSCAHSNASFSYTGTIQTWTVPACITQITVVAAGASGQPSGEYAGGAGAVVTATVTVTGGSTIDIVCGESGPDIYYDYSGGGGGGTYVWNSTNTTTPLVVAGGGGGGGYSSAGNNGSTTLTPTAPTLGGAGGSGGSGGGAGTATKPGPGGGGAGWLGNGANGGPTTTAGQGGLDRAGGFAGGAAPTNAPYSAGGYGGGGSGGYNATSTWGGGGGGGGYNGGGGGTSQTTALQYGGGGGGSGYYNGTSFVNPVTVTQTNSGTTTTWSTGYVTITW